jgi:hypothetical protein
MTGRGMRSLLVQERGLTAKVNPLLVEARPIARSTRGQESVTRYQRLLNLNNLSQITVASGNITKLVVSSFAEQTRSPYCLIKLDKMPKILSRILERIFR